MKPQHNTSRSQHKVQLLSAINGHIVRYVCPYRQYSGGRDAGWLYELYRGLPATEHGGWTTANYLGCNRPGSTNHVSYD